MYSTYKNKRLKRLKYIVAGLLFITILPGNAGVKNSGHHIGSEIDSLILDNIYSSYKSDTYTTPEADKEFPDKVSNKASEIKSDFVDLYVHQAKEMSPTGKSFNFFLSVQ